MSINMSTNNNNVNSSIYSLSHITDLIAPIAQKHHLKAVYIFGSYARNEAKPTSDIDILIDRDGSDIQTLFQLSGLFLEFKEALEKEIDLVTEQSFYQPNHEINKDFIHNVLTDRIKIYDSELK